MFSRSRSEAERRHLYTRIAHFEKKLDDANEAWDAMYLWIRKIYKMS